MKHANVRIILVVTYLKPRSDKGLFIEKLDEFLEELSNHNGPIFLAVILILISYNKVTL